MSYYDVLGVHKSASQLEIKKSYRKLSLVHHPDRPNGNADKFKKISEAYEILSDSEKRKMYDLQNNNSFMSMGGGVDPNILNMLYKMGGGMPFFNGMMGMGGMGGMGGMPPNIHVFRNGIPVNIRQRLQKPTPIIKTITITLEKAFSGCNYPIEIERWVQNGNTKYTEEEKIYVEIPPGIDTNEIIKISEKGNIINEHNKGDIKIFVKIENNSKISRNGLDLIFKKKISLKESLCGFQFDIKFLNGTIYTVNNSEGIIIKPDYKKLYLIWVC